MNGYMNFARNKNNMCGIASIASYPVVANSVSSTTSFPQSTTSNGITTPTTTPITLPTTTPTTTPITTPITTPTTTTLPITIAPNPTPQNPCYQGQKTYLYPGCKQLYKCSAKIYNTYSCPFNMIFDVSLQMCVFDNGQCNASRSFCSQGTGYYTYPGCNSYYFCQMTINYLFCSSGLIYNPNLDLCVPPNTYTCPY